MALSSDYIQLNIGEMVVEGNWNSSVQPMKKLKFTFGDKVAYIDRNDLYALLVVFADEEQMDQLIPVTRTRVRAVTRLLGVRAKKDMKKGELLRFPYTYWVPEAQIERLLLDDPTASVDNNKSTNDLARHIKKQ